MTKLTGKSPPPFIDRRSLPPVFPKSYLVGQLPPDIRAYVEQQAAAYGDNPGDVLADMLALAIDEFDGAVFDPRELGYTAEPPAGNWPTINIDELIAQGEGRS